MNVNVTATDPSLTQSIADECSRRGMTNIQTLSSIGVINGTVDDMEKLRDIPGVQSIDEEVIFHLPDNEEKVTW